jgi:hypothetical protein
MTDSREINYNNKENPKDSHYLPSVKLNAVQRQGMIDEVIFRKPEVQSQSGKRSYRGVLIFMAIIAAVVVILFVVNRLTSPKEDDLVKSEDGVQETIETDAALIDSTISNINPVLTQEAINNGCIIITGTFSKQGNANTMLDDIRSAGYSSYQSSLEPPIRVGLQFDCINVDLDSMLLSVRQSLSDKAWYLISQYETEL